MTVKTAIELGKALKERSIKAIDLLQSTFSTIKESDASINAYISLMEESALEQAADIDRRLDAGETLSPLAGVPIGIKDNLCLEGTRTTCASKMLENFVSPYTGTAVQKCLDQGLIPVGKCNMDEFAMGSSTEHSAFFATKNPWDLETVPGGSSGGSAATVSAGQVSISLGSDTGGSIRQPAAFCGVVGLKPTYGRVSRYGLVAFASSLDQIGPFSRTVEDSAHFLNVITGHDVHDATSLQAEAPDFSQYLGQDIKGLKIAVPKELLGDSMDDAVKANFQEALDTLVAQGASYEMVSMDSFKAALASYYIIAPAEASANLARFDGVRYTHRASGAETLKEMMVASRSEAFGEEVKRRILIGTFALSSGYYDAFYVKAQKARTVMKQDFNKIFERFDLVLSPTTPTPAFRFGEHSDNPMDMYMNDIATIPANMAGVPAMSIPSGFVNGMPVGLQLISKVMDEGTLFKVGDAYQRVTEHHMQVAKGASV